MPRSTNIPACSLPPSLSQASPTALVTVSAYSPRAIYRQPTRHAERHEPRKVARRRIGERAHVVHELAEDVRSEHDPIEQRVTLGEDRLRRGNHRAAQLELEWRRVERSQLDVRLAVVLDESAQRQERPVVPVRTSELHVAERRRAEEIFVQRAAGHPHASEVVATVGAIALAGAELCNGHVVKLIVAERCSVVADRAFEGQEGACALELFAGERAVVAAEKAIPGRVGERELADHESTDRV